MQQQQMNPHQAMYGQQFGQAQMLPSYGAQQMNFMGAGMGGMMQMMPQMMTPQQGFQMYQGGGYGAGTGHSVISSKDIEAAFSDFIHMNDN